MKLKVFVPDNHRITKMEIIYTAFGFDIEEGHLYIYADYSEEKYNQTLAVYAPGFWSTIENVDLLERKE